MTKFRVGDRVVVDGRNATVRSLGKDSTGPWVCVELENGDRLLRHPDRLRKIDK